MAKKFRDIGPVFSYEPSYPYSKLLGHKTHLLRRAMWERGIKVIVPESSTGSLLTQKWGAKYGSRVLVFNGTMLSHSTLAANRVVQDKSRTKEILKNEQLQVPDGTVADSENIENVLNWFSSLRSRQVVIKPIKGSLGRGITTGIRSKESLRDHLSHLEESRVLVEEQIPGDDYRLLVVGGKFVAGMRRERAHVIGNGDSTLLQLVKEKNVVRKRMPFNGDYPLRLHEEAVRLAAAQGVNPDTPIPMGKRIELSQVSNIGAGGDSIDVTCEVHPLFVEIAEKAALSVEGLECCGVDIMASDISEAPDSQMWAILELNANSDIPIHHWPTKGTPQDVAGVIAEYYFPESRKSLVAKEIQLVGRVQRVGVQTWLEKHCMLMAITGYSTIVAKDTVLIHAEGSEAAIGKLIKDCIQPTEKAVVRQIDVRSAPVEGFDYFSMRSK